MILALLPFPDCSKVRPDTDSARERRTKRPIIESTSRASTQTDSSTAVRSHVAGLTALAVTACKVARCVANWLSGLEVYAARDSEKTLAVAETDNAGSLLGLGADGGLGWS